MQYSRTMLASPSKNLMQIFIYNDKKKRSLGKSPFIVNVLGGMYNAI